MTENELAAVVVNSCFEIHTKLGPGLLESVYECCLHYELSSRGLFVERQKQLGLIYKGVELNDAYRIDLCVERKLIVELKTIDFINDFCIAQVLSYLKLSGIKLGLIVNFKSHLMKNGIKRVINGSLT
jgi:GxxExxY protein